MSCCCLTFNELDPLTSAKVIGSFNAISSDRVLNEDDLALFAELQDVMKTQHMIGCLDQCCCCFKMRSAFNKAQLIGRKRNVRFSSSWTGHINAFEFSLDNREDAAEEQKLEKERAVNSAVSWFPTPCLPCSLQCCLCCPVCCPREIAPPLSVLSKHEIEDFQRLSSIADKQETFCLNSAQCVERVVPCFGICAACPCYSISYLFNESKVKEFQIVKAESTRTVQEFTWIGSIKFFFYYPMSYPAKVFKASNRNERM